MTGTGQFRWAKMFLCKIITRRPVLVNVAHNEWSGAHCDLAKNGYVARLPTPLTSKHLLHMYVLQVLSESAFFPPLQAKIHVKAVNGNQIKHAYPLSKLLISSTELSHALMFICSTICFFLFCKGTTATSGVFAIIHMFIAIRYPAMIGSGTV